MTKDELAKVLQDAIEAECGGPVNGGFYLMHRAAIEGVSEALAPALQAALDEKGEG